MSARHSLKTRDHSELVDITSSVRDDVRSSGVKDGMCIVYVPHTTAGITINENADPTVKKDIINELDEIVPWRHGYAHAEGNAAAHIKATLTGSSVSIPIEGGDLLLGTWQGVFFCEFDGPRSRSYVCTIVS